MKMISSKLTVISIILTTAAVAPQFLPNSIQPDVKFNDDNDRFDLTSMIQDTNRMLSRQAPQEAEEDEYRRKYTSSEEQIGVKELLTERRSAARRSQNDFALHDDMGSKEGGTLQDYEQNLKHFMNGDNLKSLINSRRRMSRYVDYLHGGRRETRRSGIANNEHDILMHYAFPFVMDIKGYMRVPLH